MPLHKRRMLNLLVQTRDADLHYPHAPDPHWTSSSIVAHTMTSVTF